MSITYYHHPNCSKSKAGLAILQEWSTKHQIPFETILYLKTPPSFEELSGILQKLGVKAREILRPKEADAAGIDLNLSEDQLIKAICDHPKAIQRPILVVKDQAVIGRPTDNIIKLLEDYYV